MSERVKIEIELDADELRRLDELCNLKTRKTGRSSMVAILINEHNPPSQPPVQNRRGKGGPELNEPLDW